MVKKSLAIVLFILVTIGFLFGFITYNRRLSDMLGKKVEPSSVVLPADPSEPEEPETEMSEEEKPESEEPEPDEPIEENPLEETDKTSELVTIPYIIGLHKEDAVKALEDKNLVAEIHLEYIDDVEKEYVFYQRPPRNQEVPEGTTVSFSVSRGPYGSSAQDKRAIVPFLTGKTQAQAENALKGVNLLMKVKERSSSQDTKGTVISQDTSGGKEVAVGSTVTITVSSGKEAAQQVLVPDVVRMSQSAATSLLESKGLKAAVLAVDSERAKYEVTKQSIPSGVNATTGSTITISVSKGPQPLEPTEETPDPPEETTEPDDPSTPVTDPGDEEPVEPPVETGTN